MPAFSDSDGVSLSIGMTPSVLNDLWEQLLIKHGRCWARVVSDSMYPTIRRGNRVLVEMASPDQVRFGDIVVFRRNGTLTVHRIIAKRKVIGECHFLEKGDASLQSSLVAAEDILGRVTSIRNSGKPLPTISGYGRLLQLALACISYTSLQVHAPLKYCLTRGRRTSQKHRYGPVYNRFFHLLYRIVLRLFLRTSRA